jgi:hypothetical protein
MKIIAKDNRDTTTRPHSGPRTTTVWFDGHPEDTATASHLPIAVYRLINNYGEKHGIPITIEFLRSKTST